MAFDREKYEMFLIENNCVGFFDPPVTLASGRPGYWYMNFRTLLSNLKLKDEMLRFAYSFMEEHNLKPVCFYGVPEGATQWGLGLTDMIDYLPPEQVKPTIGRAKPKKHGDPKDKYFIGNLMPGDNIVVIEDVTTTGSSLLGELDKLSEAGLEILKVVAFGNRLEIGNDGKSVAELVADKGYEYVALTDTSTILPLAYNIKQPGRKIAEKIEKYSRQYGAVELKLL